MQGPSESGFHFLDAYWRCQQFFRWRMVVGLEPKEPDPKILFGWVGHAALADRYLAVQRGITKPNELLAVTLDSFEKHLKEIRGMYMYEDTFQENLERGKNLLHQYCLENLMEGWIVKNVEEPLEYEFPTGDRFTGRIDLRVTSAQGRNYIVDHKFTSWGIQNLMRSLSASDQATAYIWLWNALHPEDKIDSIMFNILRSYKNDFDCKRHIVMKSSTDVERFAADAQATLNEIATKVADPTARWTRDTGSCYRYNRPCPFLNLCAGDNHMPLIGIKYRVRSTQEEVLNGD